MGDPDLEKEEMGVGLQGGGKAGVWEEGKGGICGCMNRKFLIIIIMIS